MKTNAKAVGFVTQLLDDFKGFGFFVQIQRDGVVGEKKLFEAFGNPYDSDFAPEVEGLQAFEPRRKLSLTPVDHDQLWEGLVFLK